MEKYDIQIYASIILIIVAGLFAIVGYLMTQNVEAVGGIPTNDYFRIIFNDYNTYYTYGVVFLGGGIFGCIIGIVLLFVFAILQNSEFKVKSKINNVSSQNNMQNVSNKDDAMNILRTRYAKGEITIEQYKQMKKDLED